MICSNIGRKSDKIITKKEVLQRQWLKKRFKVKIVFPKKKDRCHTMRRHGPQYNIMAQFERTQGSSEKRLPESPFASRFYSHDLLWEARQAFLLQHEDVMRERMQKIEAGSSNNFRFSASVELETPIGEGLVRVRAVTNEGKLKKPGKPGADDMSVKHFSNIQKAAFVFEYHNGEWFEISGYPDAKDAFKKSIQSGPVIAL